MQKSEFRGKDMDHDRSQSRVQSIVPQVGSPKLNNTWTKSAERSELSDRLRTDFEKPYSPSHHTNGEQDKSSDIEQQKRELNTKIKVSITLQVICLKL